MPTPARSLFMALLAIFVVTCAFVLDYITVRAILDGQASEVANNSTLGILLGAWNSAGLGVIVGFFFGRSSDSDRKTDIIAASQPPEQRTTTTTPGKTVTETAPAPIPTVDAAIVPPTPAPAPPAPPSSPRPV